MSLLPLGMWVEGVAISILHKSALLTTSVWAEHDLNHVRWGNLMT